MTEHLLTQSLSMIMVSALAVGLFAALRMPAAMGYLLAKLGGFSFALFGSSAFSFGLVSCCNKLLAVIDPFYFSVVDANDRELRARLGVADF